MTYLDELYSHTLGRTGQYFNDHVTGPVGHVLHGVYDHTLGAVGAEINTQGAKFHEFEDSILKLPGEIGETINKTLGGFGAGLHDVSLEVTGAVRDVTGAVHDVGKGAGDAAAGAGKGLGVGLAAAGVGVAVVGGLLLFMALKEPKKYASAARGA